MIKEAEKRMSGLNINNITFRNTDESGLDDLNDKIDFLYYMMFCIALNGGKTKTRN